MTSATLQLFISHNTSNLDIALIPSNFIMIETERRVHYTAMQWSSSPDSIAILRKPVNFKRSRRAWARRGCPVQNYRTRYWPISNNWVPREFSDKYYSTRKVCRQTLQRSWLSNSVLFPCTTKYMTYYWDEWNTRCNVNLGHRFGNIGPLGCRIHCLSFFVTFLQMVARKETHIRINSIKMHRLQITSDVYATVLGCSSSSLSQ